jgi:hypothetical protein
MEAPLNTSSGNFILGNGLIPQILLALVTGIVVFLIFFSLESLVKTYYKYSMAKTVLVPNTIMSNQSIVVRQDPSDPKAQMLLPSDNELTGVEFTYSFFLFVDPATFDTSGGLKHIFYKGYTTPFPLLGPAVFMRSDENTMRIFMNSYKSWYSYVDIQNVPVQKWFYVAVVFRANTLEVYINGNLKGRIPMEKTYPYQNYQNLIIFGQSKFNSRTTLGNKVTNLQGVEEDFIVTGTMAGQLSRLCHYRYALSFAEIQANANQGPSSTVDMSTTQSASSYLQNSLVDSWYTS